jgi:protease I
MSVNSLSGKKILVLVSNGVDESVMSTVMRELVKTGATVKTVGTESGLVNSWNNNAWGLYFPVDQQISQTLGADFDCLIVPSGSRSVAKLGTNAHAERIIVSFITAGKPMAFMGNAVELLAKTNLASGWNVSGPESVQQAMTAAGAKWQGGTTCTHNALFTGDCENLQGFIAEMFAHFGGASAEQVKAAA